MAHLYIPINKILCWYKNFLLPFCDYGRKSFSTLPPSGGDFLTTFSSELATRGHRNLATPQS